MIRVRANRMIAGPWGTGPAGTIIECPHEAAKALVESGAAEYVMVLEHEAEAAVVEPDVETARVSVVRKKKGRAKRRRGVGVRVMK